MIKRDKRNLGKMVVVELPGTVWDGRVGKVVDFRGDMEKGNPWVCVFIYDRNGKTGSVYPFSGGRLKKLKEKYDIEGI